MKRIFAFIAVIFLLAFGFSPNASGQWVQTNGPGGGWINCFLVSGANIFVGSGSYQKGGGVFLSSDEGVTWRSVSSGLPSEGVRSLVQSGTNLFAGVRGAGVFRSSDNGTSWTPVNNGLPDLLVQNLIVKGSSLIAGLYDGICRSTDNGTTWIQVDSSYIATLIVSGNNIVASGYGVSGYQAEIFVSKDDGITWSTVKQIPPGLTGNAVTSFAQIGSVLIAGEDYGVFRSNDNGLTWETADSTFSGTTSLAVIGNSVFSSTYGGVYRSDNLGISWLKVSIGLSYPDFVGNLVSDGNLLLGGSGVGVFRSNDGGVNWTKSNQGIANVTVYALAGDGTNLFGGTEQNGVFRTTDNGANWTEFNNGLTNDSVRALIIKSPYIFAGTVGGHNRGIGVFRSLDSGSNWIESNTGRGDNGANSFGYIGDSLFVAYYSNIYFSIDTGNTWIFTSNTKDIGPDYTNIGMNLFAGTNYGVVLRSTDNGISWVHTTPIAGRNIFSLLAIGSHLFAASDSGIFLTDDFGTNWQRVNLGLNDTYVHILILQQGYLYAGTNTGVWRRPLSDFAVSDVEENINSSNISLSPNPTTGILTIRNAPENLTGISILNVLGQEVMEIAAPHSGEFKIDLSMLPRGIYYLRFISGGSLAMEKLIKE